MPRIKTGRTITFQIDDNMYHCGVCYKNYKGYSRALKHHKRTGHDGFTRKFVVHLKDKKNAGR